MSLTSTVPRVRAVTKRLQWVRVQCGPCAGGFLVTSFTSIPTQNHLTSMSVVQGFYQPVP